MQPGEANSAATKLRLYTRAIGSYAARLRPYASALLRHAVRAVDAVGSWLHGGIVRIGKVSPRTAERLESIGTWVGRSDRRKLSAAVLVVLVVLGAGFAAIFPETTGRTFRAITASGPAVPLAGGIRRQADEKAKQLAAALEARLDRKGKFAGEAWTSARVLIALGEEGASKARVKSIGQYFRSVEGPECACWRRLPRGEFPNHVGVTGWALWAMACYGIAAQKAELEFLLSIQHRDGGWPQFAGATDPRFASSYGTAAAILALHEQSALAANRAQAKRARAAAERGAGWLKARALEGGARWADYPAWPEAGQRGDFLGLSGFVLFALHRVGAPGLEALDRDWLRRLPAEIPDVRQGAVSRRTVQVGKRSYRDDTRYNALPWVILATAAAYPGGSLTERVRTLEWLERALAPGASIHALTGRERNIVIAAEALLALRSGVARE
jgi:hypothetical protein